MVKAKIKCSVCGKSFKTTNIKRTVCPDCEALTRRSSTPKPAARAEAAPPTLAFDVRAAFKAPAALKGEFAAYRAPEPPPPPPAAPEPIPSAPPSATTRDTVREPRPDRPRGRSGIAAAPKQPKPAAPPRARVRKEPQPPFTPTPEQIAAIRARYLELAQPEFDGIRHQIAHELAIPVRVVKSVIKELRDEQNVPSWWELEALTLTPEDIARVRDLYAPQLERELPDIGIHKKIAADLGFKPGAVYNAIKTIRLEAGLPVYSSRPEGAPSEPPAELPSPSYQTEEMSEETGSKATVERVS